MSKRIEKETHMKYSEDTLRAYIEKCFIDAFKSEDREYDRNAWSFEYIMIKHTTSEVYQLYPIMWCKFNRVERCVMFRLKNNLKKNFGVEFRDTLHLRASLSMGNVILSPNFIQAKFETPRGPMMLYVYDEYTNPYSDERGDHVFSSMYNTLLFTYWGLDEDMYNALPQNSEKRHLPGYIRESWEEFKKLYYKAFNKEIGNRYDIICSSSIIKL